MEGMVMLKGWTTGRLLALMKRAADKAASRCEPKLRYSSTPVYSTTFAEDRVIKPASPYVLTQQDIGGAYSAIFEYMELPAGTQTSGTVTVAQYVWVNGAKAARISTTVDNAIAEINHQLIFFDASSGLLLPQKLVTTTLHTEVFYGSADPNLWSIVTGKISGISFEVNAGSRTIRAGTTLTIYAMQEAE